MGQCVGQKAPFLSWSQPDTLLNVFLAIAVDNLANAQELTKVCRNTTCSLEGARRSGTQYMLPDTCGVMGKVSSWARVHVTSGESPQSHEQRNINERIATEAWRDLVIKIGSCEDRLLEKLWRYRLARTTRVTEVEGS